MKDDTSLETIGCDLGDKQSELCVLVANPRRVKLISQSSRKHDKKDAEWLARLGKADTQLLAPVHHRGGEAQADLAVAKSRDVLVRARTKLVNHVRGLCPMQLSAAMLVRS